MDLRHDAADFTPVPSHIDDSDFATLVFEP